MGATWFLTTKYRADIATVEVLRETEQCVFLLNTSRQREQRVPKSSEYEQYWPTWDEAHRHLIERCETKVKSLRAQLALAEGALGNARGLRAQ